MQPNSNESDSATARILAAHAMATGQPAKTGPGPLTPDKPDAVSRILAAHAMATGQRVTV